MRLVVNPTAPNCKTTDTHKWCSKCETWLRHTSFNKSKAENLGLSAYCKQCISEYTKTRRRNGKPERTKEQQRNHNLKKFYGITAEQYDELLNHQKGLCAICQSASSNSRRTKYLFVDHCHVTGEIRGLLCHTCNLALGSFKDDPVRLRAAIDYLEKK